MAAGPRKTKAAPVSAPVVKPAAVEVKPAPKLAEKPVAPVAKPAAPVAKPAPVATPAPVARLRRLSLRRSPPLQSQSLRPLRPSPK